MWKQKLKTLYHLQSPQRKIKYLDMHFNKMCTRHICRKLPNADERNQRGPK